VSYGLFENEDCITAETIDQISFDGTIYNQTLAIDTSEPTPPYTAFLCAANNVFLSAPVMINFQVCGLETVSLVNSRDSLSYEFPYGSGTSNVETIA